ncbi:ferritin-like domain-containing protein [Edaphobacter sp. 12200R-103]|uniref:ferritin-like domain-containing protein n=1 Tax=Edaphobacter sp. 12200R-103 TaxID=2703788 RepID=UPI00138CA1D3|nr:ferritin-like domain-containing protein [Edaphobacter sp. 12200R-103]QHS52878.1 ferritin-like domain-containing protein [Edaphobacter sp. 12200R-103]
MTHEEMRSTMAAVEERRSSRRQALLMGGAALAGLALSSRAFAQATVSDNDLLNFALNLEFLEAQYYTLAATGMTLDQAGISTKAGNGGAGGAVTVKANAQVPFTTPLLKSFAAELAVDEQNHVKFLQSQLGSAAVAQPSIDLLNSFNTIFQKALLGSNFDPFANEANFLIGAYIFEDVGVTAYQGALSLLSNKTSLDKAIGIHNVEAYHAAAIRLRILQGTSTMQVATQAISALRATLSGAATNDDVGVGLIGGALSIVDNDDNGMTFARTTSQVLNIVYAGGPAGTGGCFFPQSMNGTIR